MKQAIQTSVVYSISVAICGTILLLFGAAPIVQFFIKDPQTVQFGQTFLRIICLACITTVINFMVITIFQATGGKRQPIILSLLRKGTLDVFFMVLFNSIFGIFGIAWATPVADGIAFIISLILIIPYLRNLE